MHASSKPNSNPAVSGHACQPARAFTLVELMVVMVILSILASLAVSGILSARASGRIAKTTSTIRKLNEIILPYYEQYETRRPTLPDISGLASRKDIMDLRRAAIRRLIAMELPDRLSDIMDLTSGNIPPLSLHGVTIDEIPPVTSRYKSIVSDPTGPYGGPASSAKFLHLIVTRGPVADADIISHFRPDEMGDSNADGLPDIFVDGWQRPIAWLRWPIGFPSPYQPLDGRLSSRDERFSMNGHRLMPLIYSGGVAEEYELRSIDDGVTPYLSLAYDPFELIARPAGRFDVTGSPGEVGLYQVTWGSGPSAIKTYAATTADTTAITTAGATIAPEAFLTVGSPVNVSRSINNHAMSR